MNWSSTFNQNDVDDICAGFPDAVRLHRFCHEDGKKISHSKTTCLLK